MKLLQLRRDALISRPYPVANAFTEAEVYCASGRRDTTVVDVSTVG